MYIVSRLYMYIRLFTDLGHKTEERRNRWFNQ